MATNIIEKVKIGASTDLYALASTAYFTCTDAANETTKSVSDITGFVLLEGVTIHVKFTNGNTASQPTLNVSSTGAIPITYYGNTRTDSQAIAIPAGAVVTLTYIKEGSSYYWAMNSGYNVNTTYTFAGGTNKFTVTPLGGSAQDVTITPSITDNITGSGTSGYLTKFNDTNTITNGPQLSSAISTQTTSTKFLREDGTWAAPSYISDTHYTANLIVGPGNSSTSNGANTTTNSIYLNLIENNEVRNSHNIVGGGSVSVACDATGKITITGNNAGTVTSITPGNGLINGTSGSSQSAITNSGTISIATGGVTNDMLAGSIAITKLAAYTIQIGNVTKNLGQAFTLADLGIAAAMNFKGTTTTTLADGDTTSPITISGESYTQTNGDVVLYDGKEYVWTGSAWEQLGDESSWALANAVINKTGTTGDLLYWSNTDTPSHLAIGTGDNKFLTISNGVPAWGTVGKSDVGLGNVTNDKQIPFSTATTAGDLIYYNGTSYTRLGIGSAGQVLQVNSGATAAEWGTISVNDTNVTQVLESISTDTYPILFSDNKTSVTTASINSSAKRNNSIYIKPSDGSIHATELYGGGSNISSLSSTVVKSALGTDSTTTATFLRKDGSWKTLSISVNSANDGDIITDVSLSAGTLPTFTAGTLASATVNNAVLELVSQTSSTFTQGTYPSISTVSKANLSLTMT